MSNVFEDIKITAEEVDFETRFIAKMDVEEYLYLPSMDLVSKPDLKQKAQLAAAEKLIERIFKDALAYAKAQGAPTPGRWLADQLIKKTRRFVSPEDIQALRTPSLEEITITETRDGGRTRFDASINLTLRVWGPKEKPDEDALIIVHEDMKARVREGALRMCLEWIQDASRDFGIFKVHTWLPGLRFYESRWVSPGNSILLMHPNDTTKLLMVGARESTFIEEVKKMGLIDRILGRWPK